MGSSHKSLVGTRVWRASIAIAGIFLLAGCNVEDGLRFGWPTGITPQAEEMRRLWTWSVVAALVVGVLVWALIFWCVGRYRRRGKELPAQTRYNLPIEVLYSVVPFLIIAVLFYYTAVTQNSVNAMTKPDVTVEVTAFKWNWQFTYSDTEDADGEAVTTVGTTDEVPVLVVPTGKVIQFDLNGRDVIHSFWVPDLLFKRDVIPGHDNAFQVTVSEEGAYVGRCAEFCGTYHSNMNFELRAVSPDDFDAYLAARSEGKTSAQALEEIGQEPYSTTTTPFNPSRSA